MSVTRFSTGTIGDTFLNPGNPKIQVSGGTLYADATYYYRVFTGSNTLTVTGGTLIADIYLVGGGGNSNIFTTSTSSVFDPCQGSNMTLYVQSRGGGGGAGKVLTLSNQSVNGSCAVLVAGAGGSSSITIGATTSYAGYGGLGGDRYSAGAPGGGTNPGSGGGGGAYFATDNMCVTEFYTTAGGTGATSGGTNSVGGGGGGAGASGSSNAGSGGANGTTGNGASGVVVVRYARSLIRE